MDREERKQSERSSTGDVITQEEMASQLIFQNAEYPSRTSLLQRFQAGAQIEPGPLTITQPYFDLGPFIVPSSEARTRTEQLIACIREATIALGEIDQQRSSSEFSRAAQRITVGVWAAVLERRNASLQARNWNGFRARVRDGLYACEVTWLLWASTKCAMYGLRRLGLQTFGIASVRAVQLTAVCA